MTSTEAIGGRARAWRHWYRRALPAYWLSLAFATHVPKLEIRSAVVPSDHVLHFVAFGVLTFLFWRFVETFRRPGPAFVWECAAILLGYAALDEYTQRFVGRGVEWTDFASNAGGIVVSLVTLEVLRRRPISKNPRF